MKRTISALVRKFLKNQQGQSATVVAVTITAIAVLASASVEAGHVYYAYRELVASTNAAVMAGAQAMPDTLTAAANVTAYSSETGQRNATSMLQSVVATPSFLCLNTVVTSLNVPCSTSTGASGGYNALSVTQTATVNLWFGGLIGLSKMNLSATATAAMRGGTNTPWNIAIILDTTHSMTDPDSGTQCSGTQISCALQGVQALLGDLDPCALGETCSSGSTPVDSVALYVFPPVLATTAPLDYCSGGSGDPTHEYYMVPTLNSAWTYKIVPFSTDYKSSDEATSLNPNSDIVIASGATSGCNGIQAPGGAGTYYAQVIYTAQADLLTQQSKNAGSQNAMIILSDGNATATASYTGSGSTATFASDSDLQPSSAGLLNGILGLLPDGYTYPSAVGECGQAVQAAQAAATAGTVVYTIGYGAETSGGCASDQTYSYSVSTNGVTWGRGGQPCTALAAMASAEENFYSDDESGRGLGCKANATANQSITKLTAIFHAITAGLTSPRLIPNGTT
jgi:hypothetical protein